jgi:hypothetical protein
MNLIISLAPDTAAHPAAAFWNQALSDGAWASDPIALAEAAYIIDQGGAEQSSLVPAVNPSERRTRLLRWNPRTCGGCQATYWGPNAWRYVNEFGADYLNTFTPTFDPASCTLTTTVRQTLPPYALTKDPGDPSACAYEGPTGPTRARCAKVCQIVRGTIVVADCETAWSPTAPGAGS